MLQLHSHKPPILHRDLKSPNMLVERHWRVKVTDFNLSRMVQTEGQNASVTSLLANNPRWLAPEVLLFPVHALSDQSKGQQTTRKKSLCHLPAGQQTPDSWLQKYFFSAHFLFVHSTCQQRAGRHLSPPCWPTIPDDWHQRHHSSPPSLFMPFLFIGCVSREHGAGRHLSPPQLANNPRWLA